MFPTIGHHIPHHMSEKINYVYIGPTAARLGLVRSTLVIGSQPPPQLLSLVNLKPMVRSLFVPTSKLAEARKRMKTEGTIEWMSAQEISRMNSELRENKTRKET